jgi:transposase
VESDPTRLCELLVGLPAVNVLGVDDERDEAVVVHIESRAERPECPACGSVAWVKDRPAVELVDLECFGRSAGLVWHKHRWCCSRCARGPPRTRIAPARGAMTDCAGRWVCEQVGRLGRTVAEYARELGCDWHTVNDAVTPTARHWSRTPNSKLDECRRRVQNETVGHRGRKDDPLYRARRLLTKAHERLDHHGDTKLRGLLEAGDPRGEVRMAWHAKEAVRSIYDITDPEPADEFVDQLGDDLQDQSCPPDVRSMGRTIVRWRQHIVAWHHALVSNGPTEAVNNLIKRIKRIGFGFRRFTHYRIRVLLYAGKPNWDLLATITPR